MHQRDDALLHSGTAGGCECHYRQALFRSGFKGTGDLFAHHAAHRCHHEMGIHDDQHGAGAFNGALSGDDSVFQPRHGLERFHFSGIPRKLQGICTVHLRIIFHKRTAVHCQPHAFCGGEPCMIVAVGADLVQFLKLAFRRGLLAAGALEHRLMFFRCVVVKSFGDVFEQFFQCHVTFSPYFPFSFSPFLESARNFSKKVLSYVPASKSLFLISRSWKSILESMPSTINSASAHRIFMIA